MARSLAPLAREGPCSLAGPKLLPRRLRHQSVLGGLPVSTLTIRLPDDKHERLKALAKAKAIGVNRLMDELATVALANFDGRVRFETRAARGNPKQTLTLLDKLERAG